MKELEFLKIIKENLKNNAHIGDDCAYLKDLGIVITQDTLVEDVHFSTKYITPYQLGYKSMVVNLSDIYASGAIPKYFTVSLSLPKDTSNDFVADFYRACNDLALKYDFEIIGGDITGSDKIFISICAIGLAKNRKISSRANAKVGDYVVVTGEHGSSAAGLFVLKQNAKCKMQKGDSLIGSHLMPVPQKDFSEQISSIVQRDYAMMDTSDGLMDALFKIAQSSDVKITVDFDKIPYDENIKEVAKLANVDYKDLIFYGGEDYKLVACVDEENLKMLSDYIIIGQVKQKEAEHFVEINFGDKIQKINNLEKTFNHFGGKNEI